jgi:hypothetical protein
LIKKRSDKRKITGKELTSEDELAIKLETLIDILDSKGILRKKEFERTFSMRLHEISKARAFEDLDEEI